MPTAAEFQELIDGCDFVQADGSTVIDPAVTDKLVTVNGALGIYLKSKTNGNLLFFACSGFGSGTGWLNRGVIGRFWTTTFNSGKTSDCISFSNSIEPSIVHTGRYVGCPIRPVMNTIG